MADFPELDPGYGLLPANLGRSIAQVKSRFGTTGNEDNRPGTGFLIGRRNGRCYLATAGHMLFHHDRGEYPSRIDIYLGRQGSVSAWNGRYRSQIVPRVFVPSEFENGSDLQTQADFGLIRIDHPLPDFDRFPSASVLPVTGTVKVIGYPQIDGAQSNTPYHVNVELIERGADNFDYVQRFDYPGLSGGPLLGQTTTDNNQRAFGVHIRGWPERERAVRLSDSVRAQLRNWINQQ